MQESYKMCSQKLRVVRVILGVVELRMLSR